jgi:hypothetical protein
VLDGTGTPDDDHGDSANLTIGELTAAADASGIAVGQAAANIASTVRGLDDGTLPDVEIAKAGEPQRYVLGIAYQAGPDPRIQKGQDGGRDYFEPEELERAAFSLLSSGPRVGLFHLDGTDEDGGAAQIVESYIYRPDTPWDLGDGIVVNKGDWLVGAILSPRAWGLYQAGKLNGWSPQGVARRRRRGSGQ